MDWLRVTEALRLFTQELAAQVALAIESGEYAPTVDSYSRHTVDDLKCDVYGVPTTAHGSIEAVERESQIRNLPSLLALTKSSQSYGQLVKTCTEEALANGEVDRYVRSVASLLLQNPGMDIDTDSIVDEYVVVLRQGPRPVRATSLISGIAMQHPSVAFKLEDGLEVTIRRVEKTDLDTETLLPLPHDELPTTPSAVIEMQFVTSEPRQAGDSLTRLERILGLFLTSGVRSVQHMVVVGTFFPPPLGISGVTRSLDRTPSLCVGVFTDELSRRFPSFAKAYWPRIDLSQSDWLDGKDYLTIGHDFYQQATLDARNTPQRQVAFAVMGLEALFLVSNYELKHRLSTAVAAYTSLLGMDGVTIRKAVKDAYDIRSCFVHGQATKGREREKATLLVDSVLPVLRTCISSMGLLHLKKKQIVDMLELLSITTSTRPLLEDNLADILELVVLPGQETKYLRGRG